MSVDPILQISSGLLSAAINPHGAEVWGLRDAAGADLLWDGDPAVWSGRAPVLFPIVGMLRDGRYRLDENSYRLEKHGFARRRRFEVVEHSALRARLLLRADRQTLEAYPFDFELEMVFEIEGARLDMTALVRNRGQAVMPASFGFHPALQWPLPYGGARDAHCLWFETEEPAPIRRIDGDGLLRPDRLPTPVKGRMLALKDELFLEDALIFDQLNSRRLRYGAPTGPGLDLTFPGMPCLGVWTKPGAGYICIEPWQGIADPEGFDGDLRDKPGVVLFDAGEERRFSMSIALG